MRVHTRSHCPSAYGDRQELYVEQQIYSIHIDNVRERDIHPGDTMIKSKWQKKTKSKIQEKKEGGKFAQKIRTNEVRDQLFASVLYGYKVRAREVQANMSILWNSYQKPFQA